MSGAQVKFFGEQDTRVHGGPLYWPGTADGFPVRGRAGDLLPHEYSDIPLVMDYRAERFRLWEPAELKKFLQVMDRIVNGWYRQCRRTDNWDEEHQGLVVWLEWVQIYGEIPDGKAPRTVSVQDAASLTELGTGASGS